MFTPPTLGEGDLDDLFNEAVKVVVQYDRASASLVQRRLGIGYARAARLIDQLETAGVIGASDGSSRPREVLIRSYEDFVAKRGEPPKNEQEDPFRVPANYKVPTGQKLSKIDSNPWGKQLSDVIVTDDFKDLKNEYPILLGYDDQNKLTVTTLPEVENLIIAGNPQSKKENWIDTILTTSLLKHSPRELRLILIDSGHYLDLYNGIPHLLSPVITERDNSTSALRWMLGEAERRKKLFAKAGVRSFDSYQKLPNIADLPRILCINFCNWVEIETADAITFMTSTGLNAGIHLFIVVNRMSDQNLSADIKANVSNRALFTVTSAQDSRLAGVIGAEDLKEGEMLYRKGNTDPQKLATVFTPEANVKEVVEAIKQS